MRTELGLCAVCLTRRTRRGQTRCETCASDQASYRAALYARRVRQRLCTACPDPAAPAVISDVTSQLTRLCAEHLQRERDRDARRRAEGLR